MAGSKVRHAIVAAFAMFVLICIAVLAGSGPGGPVPLTAHPAASTAMPTGTTLGSTRPPAMPSSAPPLPHESAPAAAPAPRNEITTPSGPATIRGRCVDDRGKGLAGARVVLAASATSFRARGSYPPLPAQVTGDDGRFELRFDPPADHRFWLDVEAFERVRWRGQWRQIGPGRTIDCGDLCLSAGVLVSGVVVDSDGEPRPGGTLSLQCSTEARSDGVHPWTSVSTSVGSDGSFTFEHPVLPGRWTARLSRVITPRTRTEDLSAWVRPVMVREVLLSLADSEPMLRLRVPSGADPRRRR